MLNTGEEKNFSKPNLSLSSASISENICVRGLNCLIGSYSECTMYWQPFDNNWVSGKKEMKSCHAVSQ